MIGFPPNVLYPLAIDTDRTLYKVHNTTQTILASNNPAWSEEISIVPQEGNEVWADNGFATIEGELLYYDAVTKTNGKVSKLRRCLRNLGGRHTQFNSAGTPIYGFVVAEHHTQIVNAILKVQEFIGENFSEDESTLDWRIRHLQAQPTVFDDFACPDVEFTFNIVSSDPNTGIVAEFDVNVQGGFGSFEIQFGDGTSTTAASGTHTYAPNANVDPVVIVTSDNCQVVQTPIEREEVEEPSVRQPIPPFTVPIPTVPDIPDFVFPTLTIPSVDIAIPPIVFPCLDLEPLLGAFPSLSLGGVNVNVPSFINFGPLSIPSVITFTPNITFPSVVTFTNVPTFSPINFGPAPPAFGPIGFGPAPTFGPIGFGTNPLPTEITFGPAPTLGPIGFGPAPPAFGPIGFGPAPTFGPVGFGPNPLPTQINFGPAPTFGPIGFGPAPLFGPIGFAPTPIFDPIEFAPTPIFDPIEFGPNPLPSVIEFGPAPDFTVIELNITNFPSKIEFDDPPTISVDWGEPPECNCTVQVQCPGGGGSSFAPMAMRANNFNTFANMDPGFDNIELQYDMIGFPSEIKLSVPDIPPISVEHNIPEIIQLAVPEIHFVGPEIPKEIRILPPEREAMLSVMSFTVPDIKFDVSSLPTSIPLEFPKELPMISFAMPESIKVVGIPDVIRVEHSLPAAIALEVPEGLKVPLVFEGPPLSGELKVNWNFPDSNIDTEGLQCFALVPCKK